MIKEIDYYSHEGISLLNYVDRFSGNVAIPYNDFYQRKTNLGYVHKEDLDKYKYLNKKTPVKLLLSSVSNITMTFTQRYNEGKLTGLFKHEDYLKNIEIQELITTLGLDKDKFWLLVLFIYDFSESLCISGIDFSPSPNEQLQQLVDAINSCVTDFNQDSGTTMNKKVKMEIRIEGVKKPIIINDPTAIHFIADSCERRMEDDNTWNISFMNYQQPLEKSKEFKDSPYIYFFATMILHFFDIQPQIRNLRKKGAKHSLKEMELASRLVHFTKLSTNKAWLEIENDFLKGYLKQYKNLDFPYRYSSVYDPYLI